MKKLVKSQTKELPTAAFIASEVSPFAKTGGLGEVAGSLPGALSHYCKMIVVMPLYKSVNIKAHKLVQTPLHIDIVIDKQRYIFDVFEKNDTVKTYFIHNAELYGRDYLYGPSSGSYPDNALRFGLFCYAALELLKKIEFVPDVLHLNDWQTALAALLAREKYKSVYKNSRIVLTLHNIEFQGIFEKSAMEQLGLSWEHFTHEKLEHFDMINLLKAGIFYADKVVPVSRTYAEEITTKKHGFGLGGMLHHYKQKLHGVINGIDTEIFNPAVDKRIYKTYTAEVFAKKKLNKQQLLKEMGLLNKKWPLFIFIGRFTKQKGIDAIIEFLSILGQLEVNMVILGEGDSWYNSYFEHIKNRYQNIRIKVGFDEALSHRMFAAGDFLLMPSLYEPCGLTQMMAMHYGCVPVVSKTGGLADTVIDITKFDEKAEKAEQKGYGITFEQPGFMALYGAIIKTFTLFFDNRRFNKICRYNMSVDFSWDAAAKEYFKIYEGGSN